MILKRTFESYKEVWEVLWFERSCRANDPIINSVDQNPCQACIIVRKVLGIKDIILRTDICEALCPINYDYLKTGPYICCNKSSRYLKWQRFTLFEENEQEESAKAILEETEWYTYEVWKRRVNRYLMGDI